jgi:DNA-binding XRE family transcriptional regulator
MVDEDIQKRKSALEELRLKSKKTRAQVGREVGVSERNVYDWETGKFLPRLDRAVALARSLGIPLKTLCKAMEVDVEGIPDEEMNGSPNETLGGKT